MGWMRGWMVLAVAVLGGGCVQIMGWEEAHPGWTTGSGAGTTSSMVSTMGGGGGSAGSGGSGGGGATACKAGEAVNCYGGPEGTEGVGICKAGMKTCDVSGAGYGPCVGEVLPGVEICSTAVDEDCDGMAPPCKGTVLWAKRFGDAMQDETEAWVAADGDGNAIVVGNFQGDLNFGGAPLSGAGGSDIFVAKLGPGGEHLWSKRFGDGANQVAQTIAVDPQGNVLLAGYFKGTLDFGSQPLVAASAGSGFVAKLSPAGDHIWSFAFVGAGAASITVDGAGDVFVAGSFGGTLSFGGTADDLTAVAEIDLFLVKFDPNGSPLWSRRFGEVGEFYEPSVAADPTGNVFMTGQLNGTVDFGGNTFSSSEGTFIAKLDAEGNHQWSKNFGVFGYSYGSSIATGPDGRSVMAGYFAGVMKIGGQMLTNGGAVSPDVFLGSFASDGASSWATAYGDTADQRGNSVSAGKTGNVVLGGALVGAADFGGGGIVSTAGSRDAFIAKFDASGTHQWSKRFGDDLEQTTLSVTLDAKDNTFVVGNFQGVLDFGGGIKLTSQGMHDLFVAKLSP